MTHAFRVTSPEPLEAYRLDHLATWQSIFSEWGYALASKSDQSMTFERRYSPGHFIAAYILLFPFGLLFLMARPTQSLVMTWRAQGGGTLVQIQGPDRRLPTYFAYIENTDQVS